MTFDNVVIIQFNSFDLKINVTAMAEMTACVDASFSSTFFAGFLDYVI